MDGDGSCGKMSVGGCSVWPVALSCIAENLSRIPSNCSDRKVLVKSSFYMDGITLHVSKYVYGFP